MPILNYTTQIDTEKTAGEIQKAQLRQHPDSRCKDGSGVGGADSFGVSSAMKSSPELLNTAMLIARLAHRDQVDKAGNDYYSGHLIRVASRFDGLYPRIVGFLHDVVEDTDVSLGELWDAGFPEGVVDAVGVLTKLQGEDYFAYIRRVAASGDPIALAVKQADLEDHLRDTSAIPSSLAERYRAALAIIASKEQQP